MQANAPKDQSSNGRWTAHQHELFLIGLKQFGRDWKNIEQLVVTRSGAQIRSHAQKYFLKQKKCGDEGENSNSTPEMTRAFENQSSFSKINRERKIPQEGPCSSFFMNFVAAHCFDFTEFDFWGKLVEGKTLDEKIEQTSQETLYDDTEVEVRPRTFTPYVLRT